MHERTFRGCDPGLTAACQIGLCSRRIIENTIVWRRGYCGSKKLPYRAVISAAR